MTEPLRLGARPEAARAGLVWIHGRGQRPEDMLDSLPALDLAEVAVILPRAEGRSWYDARAVDPMTERTRRQLGLALAQVGGDVASLGLPPERLVVAGFSQGACLALEWALAGGRAAGLAIHSGCRVGGLGPRREALPSLAGTTAYLSDGDADDWIPLADFHAGARALSEAGARVRADVFPGRPHGIGAPERAALGALVSAVATGTAAWGG